MSADVTSNPSIATLSAAHALHAMAATALGWTKSDDEATTQQWMELLTKAAMLESIAMNPTAATAVTEQSVQARVEHWQNDVRPGHQGYVSKEAAVGAFVSNSQGQLLIVRNPVTNEWSYPVAAARGGLSPYNATRRMVLEQTGADCNPDDCVPTALAAVEDHVLPYPAVIASFVCRLPEGAITTGPDVRWVSRAQLPPNLWNGGDWVDLAFDSIAAQVTATRYTPTRSALWHGQPPSSPPSSRIPVQDQVLSLASDVLLLAEASIGTANVADQERWADAIEAARQLQQVMCKSGASSWPTWVDGARQIHHARQGPLAGVVDRPIDTRNRVGVKVLITAPLSDGKRALLMIDRAKDTKLWDPPGGHADPYRFLAETAGVEAEAEVGVTLQSPQVVAAIFCPDYGSPFTWIWTFGFVDHRSERPPVTIGVEEATKFGWYSDAEPLPGRYSWGNVWPKHCLDPSQPRAFFDTGGTIRPIPSHADLGFPWFNPRNAERVALQRNYQLGLPAGGGTQPEEFRIETLR